MSRRGAQRPGHRVTTRHAQALYPFHSPGGLGGRGVFIGRDASGGAFCFDPWLLYGEGVIDDPNVIVLGTLGQGKSALVKTLLWRMLLFGRRAFVLDVKREYGPLCAAAGVRPISVRLNLPPCDPRIDGNRVFINLGGLAVEIGSSGLAPTLERGWMSPGYGRRIAVPVISLRGDSEPGIYQHNLVLRIGELAESPWPSSRAALRALPFG